jgi:predicted ATPase
MSDPRHALSVPTVPDAQPRVLRTSRSRFVGRTQQLALLNEHLAEIQHGGNPLGVTVVLLTGEPGIGKSRLLDEFLDSEAASGVLVLRTGASQAEGMPPYLPFLQALGEYMAALPNDQLRAQLGPHAATLATLFPEIPERIGPLPRRHPPHAEQECFRLYEAIAALLATVASQGTLILLIDDLQWVDRASCDLLVHLACRLRSTALLIVGAYRDNELAENPPLRHALSELNRRRLLVTLKLPSLDIEESRDLASHLLRGDLAPDVAELLQRQGEGNPFFLEELLRALLEEELLVWQNGRWKLEGHAGKVLPPHVIEAVRMRLARLELAVVELLQEAAVIGRSFNVTLLAEVAHKEIEQVEEMLRAAMNAQLVQLNADGTYRCTHDIVREVLYSDLVNSRRQRLHLAIGEALEAHVKSGPRVQSVQQLAELAFHFVAAGDKERGVRYALASGNHALKTSAASEAMVQFQTAMQLLDTNSDDAQRAAALHGLADAATLAGEYSTAAAAYHSAQEQWLRSGQVAAAARAWHQLGRVRWRQEAVADALAAFQHAQICM